MEDDKKKRKKNKKKNKNKQSNEPTESDASDAKELTSGSQNHRESGLDNNSQVSEIVDLSNVTRDHITPDGDGDLNNGREVYLAEAEKQHWLDKEDILEGKIKELQAEKDAQIQKEAFLEERIKQLMNEKDGNSEKETRLKERITELEKEKEVLIHKEGSLERKIQQLQAEMDTQLQERGVLEQRIQHLKREIDAQLQNEASLGKEILELKDEKKSWIQKEAGFEQKFNQMVDEASLLNSKMVSLEENLKDMERDRDSWIRKENSAKESIASLTIDNTKLRAQVAEMELSRESLFSETQQLKEFISALQLQINILEMDKKAAENGHSNSEVEAAPALVERLMAENSELVEKVNKLHAELEQSRAQTGQFTSDGSIPGAVTARSAEIVGAEAPMPDQASGASKTIPVSDSIQSLEDFMVKDERNGELVNVNPGSRAPNSSEISEADQTLQISLEENEAKDSNMVVAASQIDDVEVSLTDSPLIGAPFRIISFVARYVSGADLVHK